MSAEKDALLCEVCGLRSDSPEPCACPCGGLHSTHVPVRVCTCQACVIQRDPHTYGGPFDTHEWMGDDDDEDTSIPPGTPERGESA